MNPGLRRVACEMGMGLLFLAFLMAAGAVAQKIEEAALAKWERKPVRVAQQDGPGRWEFTP